MPIRIEGMTPLLQVFSMPRALAFYRGILGFEVVADSGDGDRSSWVWLRLGDVDLMLNDQYEPGSEPPAPPDDRQRWHADTILYLGCRDTDAAYQYLLSRGINLDPPSVARYGMKQLNLRDPDGYAICLQWPADEL